MSILADKNSKILVQGITGTQASFHVKRTDLRFRICIDYA